MDNSENGRSDQNTPPRPILPDQRTLNDSSEKYLFQNGSRHNHREHHPSAEAACVRRAIRATARERATTGSIRIVAAKRAIMQKKIQVRSSFHPVNRGSRSPRCPVRSHLTHRAYEIVDTKVRHIDDHLYASLRYDLELPQRQSQAIRNRATPPRRYR